ncbi:hypothetical protein YC2023_025677 [Brassica napus]
MGDLHLLEKQGTCEQMRSISIYVDHIFARVLLLQHVCLPLSRLSNHPRYSSLLSLIVGNGTNYAHEWKGREANERGFHNDHHRKIEPVEKKILVAVFVTERRSIIMVELVTLDDDRLTPTEDDSKLISFCKSET